MLKKIATRFQSLSGMISCLLSLSGKKTKNLEKIISGRNVVIVASGPSIDVTDLSEIKDSVVFLVNYSAKLKSKFDSSNFFVWFSADNERILECEDLSFSASFRLITVYKYVGASLVTKTVRKNDVLLFPRVDWSHLFKKFMLKPRLVCSANNHKLKVGLGSMFVDLYPRTGVLTLISICLNFGAKSIELLGFDASQRSINYASGLNPPIKIPGFETNTIDKALSFLEDLASSRNILLTNCSPLTDLQSIPVSEKYRKSD